MSTTIDNRVVEMEFNNRNFETNVRASMATLEKLKQSLDFKGASRGFENIQSAASKCNLSDLTKSAESAQNSFSALQVVGVTALATLTHQAVNAGQRMVKALSIGSAIDGYREYETQMNAIQTILANTQKEGTNIEIVNKYLDELNEYADKTIYNFSEMTRNIGTFTAAGVNLDTSVSAIKGIANLAATSGSTSQQASTAMYQLSQAIASGTVRLMDWNSVVNAGMGGQVFQDALIRTSEHLQTGAKTAIDASGSFRESLQMGWLTTEVLTQTLDQFATAADSQEEYTAAVKKFVKQGYTLEEAKQIATMAKTAGNAATKVKTFTQLMDTLKEAMGSGWAQTWRIIVGDFEQARSLWTSVSDVLSGIINRFSEARNSLLESALGKTFTGLADKITGALKPVKKMTETVSNVTEAVADLGAVVDDVILGKFGNGQERFDALTKAGINYYEVQNEVNKKLNNSYRYSKEQIEAQDKLLGIQKKSAKQTKDSANQTNKLTDAQKNQIKALAKLSDEQLKAKGYTKEQIDALRELQSVAERLHIPFDTFIDKLDEINGRWVLIESFKNIGNAIMDVFGAIGKAFTNVFEPINADQILNLIGAFHGISTSLAPSEATLDKITRSFQGLFSAIELVTTILGGGFKLAFSVISELMEAAGVSVLDLAAIIGDAITEFNDWFQDSVFDEFVESIVDGVKTIVDSMGSFVDSMALDESLANSFKTVCDGITAVYNVVKMSLPKMNWPMVIKNVLALFGTNMGAVLVQVSELMIKYRDWIKENTFLIGGLNTIAEIIKTVIEGVAGLVAKIMELDVFSDFIDGITSAFERFFDSLGGIEMGVGVFDTLLNTIKTVFDNINDWLDTLSNSQHFGEDLVTGLTQGIMSGVGMVISAIANLAQSIIETVCAVLGIHSPSVVMFGVGKNVVLGLVKGIIAGLSIFGLGSLISSIGDGIIDKVAGMSSGLFNAGRSLFTNFWNGISAVWSGLKDFLSGVSHGIAEVFGGIDWGVVFTVLGSVGTFFLLNKFVGVLGTFAKVAQAAVKPIEGVNKVLESLGNGLKDYFKAKSIALKAEAVKSLAIAIGIVAASIWLLSKIDVGAAWNAVAIIAVITALLGGLMVAVAKFADPKVANSVAQFANIAKLALLIASIGAAFVLLAISMRLISSLDWGDIGKAGVAIGMLGAVVAGLAYASKHAGKAKQIDALANMVLKVSAAMIVMAVAAKIMASMSGGDLTRAVVGIGAMALIMIGLMDATELLTKGPGVSEIAPTLLAVAAALGIMAIVAKIIASMSWESLAKGVTGIAAFGAIMVGLMAATRLMDGPGIGSPASSLLAVAAAIGILAIVVKMVANIEYEAFAKGLAGIAILELLVIGLLKATESAGGEGALKGTAATLLAMSASIAILAGVCVLLGLVDPGNLARGIVAMSALVALVSVMVYVTKYAQNLEHTMKGIAIAIGIMAASIAILSFIDPKRLVAPTLAMAALMGMFSLMAYSTQFMPTVYKTLAAMIGAIAILAGALALLSMFPAERVLAAAVGMSLVMGALALTFNIVGMTGKLAVKAVVPLYAMVGVVALLAIILGAMAALDIDVSLEAAASISLLLLAMSGSLLILSTVGAAAGPAFVGMGVLAAFIIGLSGLLISIGAFFKEVESAKTYLDAGLGVLKDIAIGIGEIFGGLIEGFTNPLPNVGANLSKFMENLKPFIEVCKSLEPGMFGAIAELSGAVMMLTAADFLRSFNGVLFGSDSFVKFAEDLIPFGEAMAEYAEAVDGLNVSAIEESAKAGAAIANVAKNLPNSGGVAGFFAGENDMGMIADQLVPFGEALAGYGKAVRGIGTNVGDIEDSARAATAITEVAKALPNSGGAAGFFAGENDMSMFAQQLVPFGEALVAYGEVVADVDAGAIKDSAKAATALAELAEAIPNAGGVAGFFAGENDLSTFSQELVPFGEDLKTFSESVEGIEAEPIKNAAKAATALAELATALPNSGGVAGFFAGENDLSVFASNLVPFGEAIAEYATVVDGAEWEAVAGSAEAARSICELVNTLGELKGDASEKLETFNSFGDGLPAFGENIKKFGMVFQGIEGEQIDQMVKMADSIKKMVESVASCITTLTEDGAGDKFADFTDASKYTAAIDQLQIVRDALTRFANITTEASVSDLKDNAKSIETIATSAASIVDALTADGIADKFASFTDAGKYTTALEQLGAVRKSLVKFATTKEGVDTGSLSKNAENIGKLVTNATDIITSLTAEGVGEKFSGFTDAGKYTTALTKLSEVRESLVSFATFAEGVDGTALGTNAENIIVASDKVVDMIDALSNGETKAKFSEFTDVTTYQNALTKLSEIRTALVTFATGDKDNPVDATALSSGTEALSTILTNVSTMIDELDASKDQFSAIGSGEIDYSAAIDKLNTIKNDLSSFVNIIGEDGNTIDAGTVAANVETLKSMLNSIKNMITTLSDNSTLFSTFGENEINYKDAIDKLQEIRTAITTFANFGGEGSDLVSSSTMSTNTESLNSMLNDIKGMITTLNGSMMLFESFGKSEVDIPGAVSKLGEIAEPLTALGDKISGITASDFTSYSTAVSNVVAAINSTNGIQTGGVKNFVTAVEDLAGADIAGLVATLGEAKGQIEQIGGDMATAFTDAFTTNASASATNASGVITALAGALSDTTAISTAGTSAGEAFATAVGDASDDAETAGSGLADSAASGASDNADAMTSAGHDLGDGLILGIQAKEDAAYDAGYELGRQAVLGEKAGQESESPSKATYRAGIWFGEGLVNGIGNMTSAVYNAGHDLGDTAVSSLSLAMDRTLGMIDGMDAEAQPTIRPVIDLSNVESGVGTISDMLNMNPSIGMTASLNSIGMNVNERQNGEHNALLSAIGDLRTAVSGNAGNTYIIDGITYDDGSNIVSAVETLVSAARIERRA